MRRTRKAALITLAMLGLFTLAAAVTVARILPARLAALRVPVAADRPVVQAVPVLPAETDPPALPSWDGLSAAIGTALRGSAVGAGLGVVVVDAATGKQLYAENSGALATPASTTKVVTAVTALAALGPDARFTTSVRQTSSGIVLVGGGDPTLAVNRYPSSDYPQPATLASLAASTARALKAEGRGSVRLGYDTSLYSGPAMAPGWTNSDVRTGNVTPIASLEADQGRLTRSGAPQDSDDPVNFKPRTMTPAEMAVGAFASLLRQDGIALSGVPSPRTAPAGAATLASVSSPPLSAIAEQMLRESNNVIAENLGRHLALVMGMPASFRGAAAAVAAELQRLGVRTPISLVDTSGLSPRDGIAPETLVSALEVALNDAWVRAAITGLPVAGFTGTLSTGQSVFGGIGGTARGMVRAKTGNLNTVATLAGLAYDRSGTLLVFAIMAPRVTALKTAADEIDSAAGALADCGCR